MSLSKAQLAQGLKFHNTPKFKNWLGAIEMSCGVSEADATKAVNAAIRAKLVAETSDKLSKSLSSLNVPKGLTGHAKTAHKAGLTIVVAFDKDTGKASYTLGKSGGAKTTKTREGATRKGNYSAAVAVAYGNKHGDNIPLTKHEDGSYTLCGGKVEKGKLRAALFTTCPDSAAVAKLREYGYTS